MHELITYLVTTPPYLVFNCFAVTLQAVWALRGISHLSPCMALQGPFSAPNSNITFWWCLASPRTGNLRSVTTWQTSTPPCQKIMISIRKTSTSALLTMPKSLCGSQQTVDNSSKDGNTRPPDLPPDKSVCRSRSNS